MFCSLHLIKTDFFIQFGEKLFGKVFVKFGQNFAIFSKKSETMPTSCVGLIAIYKSLYLGQVPILKKNQLGSADIVGTIEFLFALKEMPNNNQVSNILPTHSTASAFSPVKQVNNSRSKYLFYDCWL